LEAADNEHGVVGEIIETILFFLLEYFFNLLVFIVDYSLILVLKNLF